MKQQDYVAYDARHCWLYDYDTLTREKFGHLDLKVVG
jgi:hypothetical protein